MFPPKAIIPAAAITASGEPPIPIIASTSVSGKQVANAAVTSPSSKNLTFIPIACNSKANFSCLGRRKTLTINS